MLLIWDVTSSAGAKNYYAGCLAAGSVPDRQGYYSEGQESPGTYSGKLAERLGIAGRTVDEDSFNRLCDNLHPTEGTALTPRTNDFRRVLKDLTFSGPKSFSILEAFATEAERQDLRRVFDEAVNETVEEDIEPDMQTRVRIGGADYDRVTGNALVAGFDHFTSRPVDDHSLPDMHYHSHRLFFNATHDPVEGRIKAGQVGDIVRDKGYYRAAFYARLAGKLEALGYAIDRRGDNDWEIAGVPQAVIDRFSKRTQQIEDKAKELKITDAAEKGELGAKIRARKQQELTLPELRTAWAAQLTDGERDALAAVYARQIAPGRPVTAAEAVEFALGHASEKLSVFPEREIKRLALLHGLGSLTPGQVAAELPRHGVITAEHDGRLMATTQKLQREEDYLVGRALAGRGTVKAVGISPGLTRTLEGGKTLNDGQWEAVCGLLTSENRVNLLQGPAGAGKSSLLAKYAEGMERAGQAVTWLATTSDAAGVLAKDGFDAGTVARFLLDTKQQAAARGGWVVVDETSMLGHRDAVTLFQVAEANDIKLVFVGDPMQHGSVARGALMRLLTDYGGITPFRLTEIIRQEDPEYRAAATLLSQGRTLEGFDALDGMGRVVELGDATDRTRHIAADYLQALIDKKSVLVVSPTHAESKAITEAIREELKRTRRLGAVDHAFTRLVPVDASVAQRGQASAYRPGDVIQFHQNAKGFTKGCRLTVTDPTTLPLAHAGKFSLYRPQAIALATGDRLRFTGNVKTLDGKHTFKNGTARTVREITPGGNIRLDDGKVISASAGHFRHGFVETSFGSQGRTVQRVILGMAAESVPAMNMEQLYVSASRAKEWVRLYTDDKTAVRQAVARSSQKLAALDLKVKKPVTAFTPSDGMQRHQERQRRLSVVNWMRAAAEQAQPQKLPHTERQAYGFGR